MLPGPRRQFVSDRNGFTLSQGSDAVGYNPVRRPVTAANDISRPRTGNLDRMGTKKRSAIRMNDHFCAGFAGTIRIMAAQRIFFPVSVDPFTIFVAFIRSEEHTSELQSLAYLVCRLLLEKTIL